MSSSLITSLAAASFNHSGGTSSTRYYHQTIAPSPACSSPPSLDIPKTLIVYKALLPVILINHQSGNSTTQEVPLQQDTITRRLRHPLPAHSILRCTIVPTNQDAPSPHRHQHQGL
ncbi:hypothetical protein TNCV_1917041 [Trichonephila clavipes]|uniref:Uncharacterized protein n=1 Tax=Trichonephila clavipes TaxID=2585209 RepID=A0A8X7BCT2_TRICX|nr:hypothetical protein TNCV_1917041 [Trichonephila clavipes]